LTAICVVAGFLTFSAASLRYTTQRMPTIIKGAR
jgi:hypothetical protein